MTTLITDGMAKASDIRTKDGLREVDREALGFQELRDSIDEDGCLSPPSVTVRTDEDGEEYLLLVDGLHRFTAMRDLGMEEVPVYLITKEDSDLLLTQIVANAHRIETKPSQYAKALEQVLVTRPGLSKSELATQLSKSTAWLDGVIKLKKLRPELAELVDNGTIKMANAITLSGLPEEEQEQFGARAVEMTSTEFKSQVQARQQELNQARKEGRTANPEGFVAKPRLRKLGELVDESENLVHWKRLADSVSTTAEAYQVGVLYAISLDPASVADAEEQWEARIARSKAQREQAALERKARKSVEARRKGERVQVELDLFREGAAPDVVEAEMAAFDAQTAVMVEEEKLQVEATTSK